MKKFIIQSGHDGLAIHGCASEPAGEAKGIVQFSHGMCEHKERYFPFMEWLSEHGYVCVIHDHRGHGESVHSQEDLGYMYEGGWHAMVEDLKLVTQWARSNYPGLELTLFGHSMGSMVVRSFTKRYDSLIDRLIVCGCPSYNPASGAGRLLARLIAMFKGWKHRPMILQAMSFGNYNKQFKGEKSMYAWLCTDPQILKDYRNDPLCHYIFTCNGFYNLLGLMMDCYSAKGWAMAKPEMPVHFISGGDDPCRISDRDLAKAADTMRKVGYKNVDVKTYPGMRHEILNEVEKMRVWEDVLKML